MLWLLHKLPENVVTFAENVRGLVDHQIHATVWRSSGPSPAMLSPSSGRLQIPFGLWVGREF